MPNYFASKRALLSSIVLLVAAVLLAAASTKVFAWAVDEEKSQVNVISSSTACGSAVVEESDGSEGQVSVKAYSLPGSVFYGWFAVDGDAPLSADKRVSAEPVYSFSPEKETTLAALFVPIQGVDADSYSVDQLALEAIDNPLFKGALQEISQSWGKGAPQIADVKIDVEAEGEGDARLNDLSVYDSESGLDLKAMTFQSISGSHLLVKASCADGVSFAGWLLDDGTVVEDDEVSISAGHDACAAFHDDNSACLSVISSQPEYFAISKAGEPAHGGKVTLSAEPADDLSELLYDFAGWYDCDSEELVSKDEHVSVSADETRFIEARFSDRAFDVTAEVEGAKTKSVKGSGTYYPGQSVFLEVEWDSPDDLEILGWTLNGNAGHYEDGWSSMTVPMGEGDQAGKRSFFEFSLSNELLWRLANSSGYDADLVHDGRVELKGATAAKGASGGHSVSVSADGSPEVSVSGSGTYFSDDSNHGFATVSAQGSESERFECWRDDEGNVVSQDENYRFDFTKADSWHFTASFSDKQASGSASADNPDQNEGTADNQSRFSVSTDAAGTGFGRIIVQGGLEVSSHNSDDDLYLGSVGEPITVIALPSENSRLADGVTLLAADEGEWHRVTHAEEVAIFAIESEGSHLVRAAFESKVTIKAEASEGGSVEGGGSFWPGDAVELQATPQEGFEFECWVGPYGRIEENPLTLVVPNGVERASYTAKFSQQPETCSLSVSVQPEGSGIVTADGNEPNSQGIVEATAGDVLALHAEGTEGYSFDHWADDEGNELSRHETLCITAAADKSVQAVFVADQQVKMTDGTENSSVLVEGPGNVIGEEVQDDASALLNAVPDPHARFIGWYSDGELLSIDSSYAADWSKAENVTAKFEPERISLSASATKGGRATISIANDGEGGEQSSSITLDYGQSAKLAAIPSLRYRFVGWSADGGSSTFSSQPNVVIEAFDETDYTAIFEQVYAQVTVERAAHPGVAQSAALEVSGIDDSGICSIGSKVTLALGGQLEEDAEFVGWYVNGERIEDSGEDHAAEFTVESDTDVFAVFLANDPIIIARPDTEGSARCTWKAAEAGTRESIGVFSDDHHHLEGWKQDEGPETELVFDAENSEGLTSVLAADNPSVQVLTAEMAPNALKIDVRASEGGNAEILGEEPRFGDEIRLVAHPDAGSSFGGWYQGDQIVSSSETYTAKAESDANYTAVFDQTGAEEELGSSEELQAEQMPWMAIIIAVAFGAAVISSAITYRLARKRS